MKKILTIAALLIGYFTYAIGPVTYYVKAGGNDAANGLSDANAWGTIAKVNGFTFATGDTIKFKQGDTFYGSIVVPVGNLVFTAYGIGAQPLITGFTTLSGWTNAGGGVWNISAPAVKNTVNMVTLNGVAQEVGRYPNSDAANGGYLTDSLYSGNTTYTCPALNGTNWTGAEVVARVHGYRVERNTISSQTAGTITYARTIGDINPRYSGGALAVPFTPPSAGFGLFIQRDIRTLDKLGEWYFNPSTKVMSMYFGAGNPTSYTINVSTVDTLINLFNKSSVTINNIAFEGANLAAIYFVDGTNRTITNCTINNSGYKGILGWFSSNTIIDNNTITNSMSGGIDVRAATTNVNITNNTITNTGMLKGMSSFYDAADCNAIWGTTCTIRKNIIDSVGYIGIHLEGLNNKVDSNYINRSMQTRNDGGAIYAYFEKAANSTIINNIITNIGNATAGTQEFNGSHGIYMDGGEGGVQILRNTIGNGYNIDGFGLFFNSPINITASYNTVFNANGWYIGRQYDQNMYNHVMKQNVIFNTTTSQKVMLHTHSNLTTALTYTSSGIQNDLQQLGTIDSNYYNIPGTVGFSWYYASTTNNVFDNFPAPVSFATWKTYTGLDAHTVSSNFSAYQLVTNPTNNSVVNSFTGFSKKDVFGTVYNDLATIPAWSSKVLIDNGTTATGTPPTVNPAVVVTGCTNCIITNQIPRN